MARYLFSSHDGFGLGHVRRNTLIAHSLLQRDPDAEVTIVTGLAVRPLWLDGGAMRVVHVPPLLKDAQGSYRALDLSFAEAVATRERAFLDTVDAVRPDVVVVDRHPYGVAGELRAGLERAAGAGAALVLGLRDVLDDAGTVRRELAGAGWRDVPELFDEVLTYGERVLCDQQEEYGLPLAPRYCGWVVDPPAPRVRDPLLLVVTGGGGADGDAVFRLGAEVAAAVPALRTVLVAGPYSDTRLTEQLATAAEGSESLRVMRNAPDCGGLMAGAGAVIQMAGYNSTLESLAAGVRPVLVPRRAPRREQAIRALRLAALGVADVVDAGASLEEVMWLLSRPRLLRPGDLADAGIRLDGAARAAARIADLAAGRGPTSPQGPVVTAAR